MENSPTFNTKQVIKILGVKDRRFRYWDSIKAFSQYNNSIGRSGMRKKYDFKSIVEAGIIREFDNNNIAVELGKRAVEKLKEKSPKIGLKKDSVDKTVKSYKKTKEGRLEVI